MQAYYIIDNGGRSFKTEVRPNNRVDLFKWIDQDENTEEDMYEKTPRLSWKAQKVFIGKSGPNEPEFDGNSILLKIGRLRYVFIGWYVFEFTAENEISSYTSRVGNSGFAYPYAVDVKGIYYIMLDECTFSTGKSFQDVYAMYYPVQRECRALKDEIKKKIIKEKITESSEKKLMDLICESRGIVPFKNVKILQKRLF